MRLLKSVKEHLYYLLIVAWNSASDAPRGDLVVGIRSGSAYAAMSIANGTPNGSNPLLPQFRVDGRIRCLLGLGLLNHKSQDLPVCPSQALQLSAEIPRGSLPVYRSEWRTWS